jgi:hypothetical protein
MTRRSNKPDSALDNRQRKLDEEAEKLKQREAQLNRVIEEAPRLKAERVKAQREELLMDRSIRNHRLNSSTLVDSRFDQLGGRPAARPRRKALKAERRQTRLIFLGLLLMLAVLVVWLLSVFHGQWPS